MKKLLTIFLCCLMLTPLVACGGTTEPEPSIVPQVTASQPVETEAPAITSINLDYDQTDLELDIKDTFSIPVEVLEEGADTAGLKFSTTKPAVLTFTPQEDGGALVGVVTPKAEGTAEISVFTGQVQSQVITVTVIDAERIAAEEAAAQKAAEEEAARKAAEEETARKAAEEAAAQQAAQQQQQQSQQSQSNGRTVYITPTGKRYHYDNHCNGGTYIPSTKSEAQAMGLTPCKKCAGG